jgi:nucleoside-diphosphate-sugar epimerase
MKIFIAGGSGAIGAQLIPRLVAADHTVVAMTRSATKRGRIEGLGAESVLADAFDRTSVVQAVMRAEPDVVIHQLTNLVGADNVKHFDRVFAATNRLRVEGTDNLLGAARSAGARRFIAQSYGNWNFERGGTVAKTEEDPFDPSPPREQTESMQAIRHLETVVRGAEGIEGMVLRYANFYGPGTSYAPDGVITEMVHNRRFPIVGDGAGVWSFIHVDDAATATIAALDRGAPGIYNIADDDPAPVAEWLPAFASAVGAKRPYRVPVWLGRLAAGEVGVSMMTRIRGAANGKAKRELGWTPAYPSWRDGFAARTQVAAPVAGSSESPRHTGANS